MYEPRTYRDKFEKERFISFIACHEETDLWIGLDKYSYKDSIRSFVHEKILEYRNEINSYAEKNIDFVKSYKPLRQEKNIPEIVNEMIIATEKAGIGPMGAVAGAFSQFIGKSIEKEFNIKEIIIENGGDIYVNVKKDVTLSVYAGRSVLSEKIGIVIPAKKSPLGICTSAGTVGHSKSFGKADAVMIACKNTLLADAYATAYGNKIKTKADIETVLDEVGQIDEILSAVIICDDKVGIRGEFEMKVFK